jgi:hypothetical protein
MEILDGDPGRDLGRHDGPRTLISWDRLVVCELVGDRRKEQHAGPLHKTREPLAKGTAPPSRTPQPS